MRTALEIANDLVEARAEESAAETKRIALEQELIEVVGQKEEGAQTHQIGDYKVVITGRISRKIDWDMYDKTIASKIPDSLQPVRMKRELDVTGVKYLQNNEPQLYKLIAKALTVEKAKTTVSINVGA